MKRAFDNYHRLLPAVVLALAGGCALQTGDPQTWLPDAQSEEARVYIEQCGGCHALPHPRRLSAAAWEDMVAVMDRRRAERDYPPLSETQRKKLMAYLAEHAR